MSSLSRSRSRSPARWNPRRLERHFERRERVSIERRRSLSRSRRFQPWRPRYSYSSDENSIIPLYCNLKDKSYNIPEFDPEKSDLSALEWLNRIEQLATIHSWNDTEKSHYMQSRLVGFAKMWHSSLRTSEFTWQEWKQKVLEAFPQSIDYAEALKEMLGRKKGPNETMTRYFHSKCNLLTKCEITDERAVSCIIDGLPFHMRTSARAGKYKSPGEFYSDFLCGNDDKKSHLQHSRIKSYVVNSGMRVFGKKEVREFRPRKSITCFLCNEAGHIVRACPKNQNLTKCDDCGKIGQKTEECCQKSKDFVQQDRKGATTEERE